MREYAIHPEHKVLFDTIVIDRRINEESFLRVFKEHLSKFANMTNDDFARFETFSGYTPQELLFAVSLVDTFCVVESPSREYLDRFIEDTARWVRTRSTLHNLIKLNTNGRYLGEMKIEELKNEDVFKFEIRHHLTASPVGK